MVRPRLAGRGGLVYDPRNSGPYLGSSTMPSLSAVAHGRASAEHRLVRAEVLATLRLGLPLAATQLAQITINTTDVLLLGRLGPEPLAAASLGLSLFFFLFVTGMGVVSGTSPLLAQAVGAGQHLRVRRIARQGF